MQLHSAKQRRGFTLVELAVVIGIISLLAAALLPAIWGAVTKAREARIAFEISAISQALDRYKLEFGEFPPDFSIDAALISIDEKRRLKRNLITQHLQQVFRRRSASLISEGTSGSLSPAVLNGSDQLDDRFIDALNPKSALSFWLSGFSTNPQFPLANGLDGRPADVRKPIFDFDKSRLQLDPLMPNLGYYFPKGNPALAAAFIYYQATPSGTASSDGISYLNAVNWALLTNQDGMGSGRSDFLVPFPAVSSSTTVPDPNTAGQQMPAFVAPQKYQLFYCGSDSEYYAADDLSASSSVNLPDLLVAVQSAVASSDVKAINQSLQGFPNGENELRGSLDNYTSFSEGQRLEDLKP